MVAKAMKRLTGKLNEVLWGNPEDRKNLTKRFVRAFPSAVVVLPKSDADGTIKSITFELPDGSRFMLEARDLTMRLYALTLADERMGSMDIMGVDTRRKRKPIVKPNPKKRTKATPTLTRLKR